MLKQTIFVKKDAADKKWYLVDAANKTLGRLATRIAVILSGKDKPYYTPNTDTGDFVVVINAEKVKITGKKLNDKIYHHHTFYPGGLKSITLSELMKKHPEDVLLKAVKGMMPKGKLGRAMIKKLKVHTGGEHNHMAQKPEKIEIEA
ncbi:MAG TPA: 50S ribosomal protein L13 [bacterium]